MKSCQNRIDTGFVAFLQKATGSMNTLSIFLFLQGFKQRRRKNVITIRFHEQLSPASRPRVIDLLTTPKS
jgi:hypothetical protein